MHRLQPTEGQPIVPPKQRKRRLIDRTFLAQPRPRPLLPEEVADTVLDCPADRLMHDDQAVIIQTPDYIARERVEALRYREEQLSELIQTALNRPLVFPPTDIASPQPLTSSTVRRSKLHDRAKRTTLRPALELLQDDREAMRPALKQPFNPARLARKVLPDCDVTIVGPTANSILFRKFWQAQLVWARSNGDLALATTSTTMLDRAERVGVSNIVGLQVHRLGLHHAVWVDMTNEEVVASASPAHTYLPVAPG